MLTCGLVGLPMTGKTTIFNLLTDSRQQTSAFFSGKTEAHRGIAIIPDPRLEFLSHLYRPRRTIFAQLEVVDVAGLVKGASEGMGVGNAFLNSIRPVDALLHIVRAFSSPEVPHPEGSIDPLRDIETINLELWLADLEMIEKRIERIESGKKKAEQLKELAVLQKVQKWLQEEKTVNSLELTPEESQYIKAFSLLTSKPMLLVVNLDDEQLRSGNYPGQEEVKAYAREKKMPLIEICAQTELEINELEKEEQEAFLKELGIQEKGIATIARAMYESLGLISFFTVGEDEVRAWTIKKGTSAKAAAGKIHSDMERGFIRAEVVKYKHLKEWGSMQKVKEKGLFRLEGKDYPIEDGDIVTVRFHV